MLPLFDVNPRRRTPVFVLLFLAINIVMLVVEQMQGSPAAFERFVRTWGLVPANLWRTPEIQVWLTPLTSMFLHGDWMHLLGNCWFLWLFGNNIEDRLGHARFVVFYVLCGLAAAALQVAVAPFSLIPMVGASGAISGVLGAYMRYFPTVPIFTLVPFIVPIVPIPAFVFTVLWFVFQLWQGAGSLFASNAAGGVAWWAHIGGFVAGFILAGRLRPRGRR